MNTGTIVIICFAIPIFVALVIREHRWRSRLNTWHKSDGKIIGFHEDPGADISCPIVGYNFQGRDTNQVCEFNLRHHRIGQSVPILVDPESGQIYIISTRDRWTLSVILLCCFAFLIFWAYITK